MSQLDFRGFDATSSNQYYYMFKRNENEKIQEA